MIIYDKNKKLFGALGNIPMRDDLEVAYLDENGEKVELLDNDTYVDNGHGGIVRKSDGKTIEVYVEGFKVIPSSGRIPDAPALKKFSKYLYGITFDDVDYEFADKYFRGDFSNTIGAGMCTSVWKDGKLYRNFDWNYNDDVAFAVHINEKVDESFVHGKRFASSGTSDFIPKMTTKFIESGQYSNMFKIIPFKMMDGANENKVCCSINVVPRQRGETTNTVPEIEVKHNIQASALVRFILDNFETAEEAVNYIKNYVSVYPSKELLKSNYDIHYLIADASHAFIVEAIDNKLVSKEATSSGDFKPIITNFHVLQNVNGESISFDDGHVYTPATVAEGKLPSSQGITSHAAGLERYNIIVDNYNDLSNFRNLVLYNNAYTEKENPWYSEFVGNYSETYELTVDDLPEKFNEYVMPYVYEQYKTRSRDKADTWHTTHTAEYDLESMKYIIVDSSESGIKYEFNI